MSSTRDPSAGWYIDPENAAFLRYWSGDGWTEHRREPSMTPTHVPVREPKRGPATSSSGATAGTARPATPVAQAYANPGLRLGAIILDWVLVSVVGIAIILPATLVNAVVPNNIFSSSLSLMSFLAAWVFILGYPVVAEGRIGQTYGKHLLGIRVVSIGDGGQVGVARAFGRAIIRVIGVYALGLGVLWTVWDDRHQGWHDKAVGSVVVTEPSRHRDNPLQHLRQVLMA